MGLELSVEKRLAARVVFVIHFLCYIPPVKRMFCTLWHRKSPKVFLGIACELQIAAGKFLSL